MGSTLHAARRTLRPRMQIQPRFTEFTTRLHHPQARVFFANCVCLLPGTLAPDVRGRVIDIHMLDTAGDARAELLRLENAVAAIYRDGEKLDRSGPQ